MSARLFACLTIGTIGLIRKIETRGWSDYLRWIKGPPDGDKPRKLHVKEPKQGKIPSSMRTRLFYIDGKLRYVPDMSDEIDNVSPDGWSEGGFAIIKPGQRRDGSKIAVKLFKRNGTCASASSTKMASSKVSLELFIAGL